MRLSASRILVAFASLGVLAVGCDDKPAPLPSASPSSPKSAAVAPRPTPPPELSPAEQEQAAKEPEPPPPPHPGPWVYVTSSSVGIYSEPSFDRKLKLGYAQNGSRLPVEKDVVSRQDCSGGWYTVVGGGYVCKNSGTLNAEHPEVKFAVRQPDWDAVLPYQYARNAHNGTPLYKSVPSRQQMEEYEPYLSESKNQAKSSEDKSESGAKASSREKVSAVSAASKMIGPAPRDAGAERATQPVSLAMDAGAEAGAEVEEEPEEPWWQRENVKDSLHEVTLEQLSEDADDVIAKRLVTGFYVAIDKTFRWNGRTWYRTTKRLVAPADRFWQTSASDFHGVELGKDLKLPVAWGYGGRKQITLFKIDEEKKTIAVDKSVARFEPIQLTDVELELRGRRYLKTAEGSWVRAAHVRVTRPGPAPEELGDSERWLDVNLGEQTLVAYEGTTPVYATLISSGKESRDKQKDHRTPVGTFRIREKHVTTTMDGNGTAAGDLPYSIEDVPYVMYFHRAYAVHGAFWHRNYGVQMSHGCVNLAPLDAKFLFRFTAPRLPEGWHGVWATPEQPGSLVVVHE